MSEQQPKDSDAPTDYAPSGRPSEGGEGGESSQGRKPDREEELASLRGVREFALGTAHDLKNALWVAQSLLESHESEDDEQSSALQELSETLERMAAMVWELSAFTQSSPQSRGPIDASLVVERTTGTLNATLAPRRTRVFSSKGLPLVEVNKASLQRLLVRLALLVRDNTSPTCTIVLHCQQAQGTLETTRAHVEVTMRIDDPHVRPDLLDDPALDRLAEAAAIRCERTALPGAQVFHLYMPVAASSGRG